MTIPKTKQDLSRENMDDLLRIRTAFESVKLLTLQSCAENDPFLLNFSTLFEIVMACEEMNNPALQKAKDSNVDMRKLILHIMANRVRRMIRDEIGDASFSILIHEVEDRSKNEHMAIILRFLNSDNILTERLFAVERVDNDDAEKLKRQISDVLVSHNLNVQKMSGQAYDGAGYMHGALNKLQDLLLSDCSCAYYVHSFAHKLEPTLVSVAWDVFEIWEFLKDLENVVEVVASFPKLIDELQIDERNELEHILATAECESGKGANHIDNLWGSGATCWSSYINSITNLLVTYNATLLVLEKTALVNYVHDDGLFADFMTIYMEQEIAEKIDVNSIMGDFSALKSDLAVSPT